MPTSETIRDANARVLTLLSRYLQQAPDFIDAGMIDEVSSGDRERCESAFATLLAAACRLDPENSARDRQFFADYFRRMVHRLDAAEYRANPYFQAIRIPEIQVGRWELKHARYAPYEAFVCNDPEIDPEGRLIPQIGFFDRPFDYPVVLEGGREWMTVTPNEIETMKEAVAQASGQVLTFGLGLGYYAFMASRKDEVAKVTVVEKDAGAIALFQAQLLPQFPHPEKVELVQDDAFAFAEKRLPEGGYDFVFTDLWHDPSDGTALYLRMKGLEKLSPGSTFSYWIEKTLKYYLGLEDEQASGR